MPRRQQLTLILALGVAAMALAAFLALRPSPPPSPRTSSPTPTPRAPRPTRPHAPPVAAVAVPPQSTEVPAAAQPPAQDPREGLLAEAESLRHAGDTRAARQRLEAALALGEAPELRIALALVYLDERDDASADAQLDHVPESAREANWYAIRGRIYYDAGRLNRAAEALAEAVHLGAGMQVEAFLNRVRHEMDTVGELSSRASKHLSLASEGGESPAFARDILAAGEEVYGRLNRDFRLSGEAAIPVILYASRDFFAVTGAPDWAGGLYDGKVRLPVGHLSRITPEFQALLAHELTHALIRAKAGTSCPRWLHEGLAQHYQGGDLGEAVASVVDASGETSLADPARFYALSLARVEFLIDRHGTTRIMQLLEALKTHGDYAAALDDALGLEPARFDHDFVAWLKRQKR